MEHSSSNSEYNWIGDLGLQWATLDYLAELPSPTALGFEDLLEEVCCVQQVDCRKRSRDESNAEPNSRACREKMRRHRLNDRFQKLSSIIDPGRPPKSDKLIILDDATHALIQLKNEAKELKEENDKLQDIIKDMMGEKAEFYEDNSKLKADKERLEHQIKITSIQPTGYVPYHAPLHTPFNPAFAQQDQATAIKSVPFPYPGFGAWQWLPSGQWLPPASRDTTEDEKHISPTA